MGTGGSGWPEVSAEAPPIPASLSGAETPIDDIGLLGSAAAYEPESGGASLTAAMPNTALRVGED